MREAKLDSQCPTYLTSRARCVSRMHSVSLNAPFPVMAGKKWYLIAFLRSWKGSDQNVMSTLDIIVPCHCEC